MEHRARADLSRVTTALKKLFIEEFPPSKIQQLVAVVPYKGRALARDYEVKVMEEMLQEKAHWIELGTQDAPKLAQIIATLGRDGNGYLAKVVKPIIVERLLRVNFYQDRVLHAVERGKAISTRSELVKGNKYDEVEELILHLSPSIADATACTTTELPVAEPSSSWGNTNKAEAQMTLVLDGANQKTKEPKHYFSDLDPELAEVLKKHLQKPGDVSPIVESPSGFRIYQVGEMINVH